MNSELNKLLHNLEPEIDKKCLEIKINRKNRIQNILFVILSICFISIPSILLLLNISLIYFFIAVGIIFFIKFILGLPDILSEKLEGKLYEQTN